MKEEPFSQDEDFDLSELNHLLAEDHTMPAGDTSPSASPGVRKKARFRASKAAPGVGSKSVLRYAGIGAAVLILCIVFGVFLGRALDPYDNRILPGTTLGGVPVGGMTRSEANHALTEATRFSQEPMVVTLPEGVILLSPENTHAKLNVRSAVAAAYNLGRKGTDDQKQAAVDASTAGGTAIGLLPYLQVDQDYIRSQLEAYAAQFNVPHTELSYQLAGQQPQLQEDLYDPSAPVQTLELTLGTPRVVLDVEAVLAEILNAYSCNTLTLSIDSLPSLSTPKEPDLDALYEEFYIAPVNTTLDLTTYQQVPGSYGYALDLETGRTLLSQAEPGDTISIPMVCIKPEILGDEAYFRDELGYCETKHTDNQNRNTNLRLACAAIDGLILQPGEEFSFNDRVGERTTAKGYLPAPAYSGTQTVNSPGGGVCQISTTLYNAALLADTEIIFRINHGYRSGYIGIGLDATVNWGGPDFQFRNSFHFPMMIKAEVSDGYVKIKLLGTDEKDYYVVMTSGYNEEEDYYTSWSYKSKYDKETGELISKEREAFSRYMK